MAADPHYTMDHSLFDGAGRNNDAGSAREIVLTGDETFASSVSIPVDDLRRLLDELQAIDDHDGPSSSRRAACRLFATRDRAPPATSTPARRLRSQGDPVGAAANPFTRVLTERASRPPARPVASRRRTPAPT
jgi:hypothetical protein